MSRPPSSRDDAISPTVVHRWLSYTLRELRQRAGITQAEAARRVGWSHGKIGHLETRHVGIRAEDLQALLPVYGVSKRDIDRYVWYVHRARQKGWWDGAPGVPDWFSLYVGLEWGASHLYSYDLGFIPGMLQTPGYARAVIADGTSDADEIEHQLHQRIYRQRALTRQRTPLRTHALIDEAALRREVGGGDVMREQLAHLAAHARGSNLHIHVQILPFAMGAHRGQLGSFSWLRFPHSDDADADAATVAQRERHDPGVVYLENQLGGVYLDDANKIDTFREIYQELRSRALSPAESAELIEQHAQGMEGPDVNTRDS